MLPPASDNFLGGKKQQVRQCMMQVAPFSQEKCLAFTIFPASWRTDCDYVSNVVARVSRGWPLRR